MADHALQSFLSTYGHGDADTSASIPDHHQSACCCGNPACAYLKQNQDSLDDLEQDVRNAAKLGQVCTTLLLQASCLPPPVLSVNALCRYTPCFLRTLFVRGRRDG
jgi:hypothetical protein